MTCVRNKIDFDSIRKDKGAKKVHSLKLMLGENIKRIRHKRNLTQDKLARLADIPYTTITKIETGVIKQPSVLAIAKIANALGVSLDELVKGHK